MCNSGSYCPHKNDTSIKLYDPKIATCEKYGCNLRSDSSCSACAQWGSQNCVFFNEIEKKNIYLNGKVACRMVLNSLFCETIETVLLC